MRVETKVYLQQSELDALELISKIKCDDVECKICPLQFSENMCIKTKAQTICMRLRQDRIRESTKI